MNNVIRHIEYLVRRHDCVVIPSWGAFIARYRSAFFDEKSGMMYPPARELSFNPGIDHNDGLLASSIARRQQISFEKASVIVAKEIEAMKNQLKVDGELTIGKIGRFLYQEESSLMFEPSERSNASSSLCYLTPVEVRPVIEAAREDAREAEPMRRKRSRFGRLTKRVARVAASVVALVGVGLLLSTPVIFDRDDNLASVSVQPVRSVQTSILPPSASEAPALKIFIPQEKSIPVTHDVVSSETTDCQAVNVEISKSADVKPVVESSGEIRMNQADRFCLIVASLPTESQARSFINEHPADNLEILSRDGKYRVYAATGSTSDEAYRQRNAGRLAERYPDAWVCRR